MARGRILAAVVVATVALFSGAARADKAHVAVSANFTEPVKEIAAAFKAESGHDVVLSFGSAGQFYTQIKQEAPFEVFLSGDEDRPKKLIEEGIAVAGSRFTYAIGKLVLWSRDPGLVKGEETLREGRFNKLAIGNPLAGPYPVAAIALMKSLNLYDRLKPKFVEGATISQVYQFIDTGNAEVGFVALSQVMDGANGSRWIVPQDMYPTIQQDAVLLRKGANNPAAVAFLVFLKGGRARAIIAKYGYELRRVE